MELRIILRIESEIAAKTEYEIVLEFFLRIENEFATKTEFGIVLEYFCEVRMKLRLRQNLELS